MSNDSTRLTNRLRKFPVYLLLTLGAFIMLLPFAWMTLTSFKTYTESIVIPIRWFPSQLMVGNYQEVLYKLNVGVYYMNTIIVTIASTVGQLMICALAAYAFGRLEFPGKSWLFAFVMASLLIPMQMTLIPKYLLCAKLSLVDTLAGIVIPGLFNAYGVFFLRQFFMTLPRSLEESAYIDGSSYFRTFWSIMLPLCSNGLVAFGILVILWAWNDLLWPLVVTSSDSVRVLSLGIACLQGEHMTDYPLMMAASVLATLPMIAVFIAGQKKFIAGIATTGLK
jgi:multiple sugar transport system permease protein